MNLKVKQAIAMARNNESLEGLVIEDLQDTQVRAVDALALAEHGIVLPEQNIYYNDEDIPMILILMRLNGAKNHSK